MRRSVAAVSLAFAASQAGAQGLEMCYDVTDLGTGLFEYRFVIETDAGWQPGMGWRWLIFGDEPSVAAGGTGVSAINDFVVYPSSFPVGPWEKIQGSGGGHNGPTFAKLNGAVLDFWIPQTADEVLEWSGTSATNVPAGEMRFSTLAGTAGGATAANFTIATLGCPASCYADCDTSSGAGVLDIFDFLCFQDSFTQSEPYACDCDTSSGTGVCDIFDFLCFQDAFVNGCP